MKSVLTVVLMAAVSMNAVAAYQQGDYTLDQRRDGPAYYDPGPQKGSSWAKLFGSTPNYRAIGAKILKDGDTSEKFRWEFGPMWYRGRLGKNQVQAFVVGQEGAQDENVSNRAFTGSTGTKTQKFLNHMGIYKSYLFLNTFVYTINGQLEDDPNFKWLEQDPKSPVVMYRHSLFDNMILMNNESIALFMGVGSGGKASIATWVNARGGDCSADRNLENCDTSGMKAWFQAKHGIAIKKDILVVGVPHPGGASPANGGLNALKAIVAGFTKAAQRVSAKMKESKAAGKEWLVVDVKDDTGVMARMNEDYKYGDAPVPMKDFTFGTNWRMGEQGTTSNRRGADTIQVFSDKGAYNNDGHVLKYVSPRDVDSGWERVGGKVVRLSGMKSDDLKTEDLPYESPRWNALDAEHVNQYDNGPCGADREGVPFSHCELSGLLQTWPDFWSGDVKPISAPSFGHGPIYRGRLMQAKVVVLADQAEHDDFFTARAMSGATGQRLQTWFKVAGVGADYGILRTLPVDTLGMKTEDVVKLATRADIVAARKKILDVVLGNGQARVIVTVGPVAKAVLAATYPNLPPNLMVVQLPAAASDEHIAKWNEAATGVAQVLGKTTDGEYDGSLTTIARMDLPSHTRWWMGSSGTRAARGEKKEGSAYVTNGDYYKVWAPKWVTQLKPKTLDADMLGYLDQELGGGRGVVDASVYIAADRDDPSSEEGVFEFFASFAKDKSSGDLEIAIKAELYARGLKDVDDLTEYLLAKGFKAGVVEETEATSAY